MMLVQHALQHGLNPFEFRAGIFLADGPAFGSLAYVLIPLNSGRVFSFREITHIIDAECLNPFEFRAGIFFDGGKILASILAS